MVRRKSLGGVVHTYQKYDPREFPSPTEPPPDLVSSAFEHALMYGSFRKLSDEELAKAVRLDPSQIANLGPSIDFLKALLEERKRKILERYETDHVRKLAARQFDKSARRGTPPNELSGLYRKAIQSEQIYLLESLWYRIQDDHHPFARQLVHIIESLGRSIRSRSLLRSITSLGMSGLRLKKGSRSKRNLRRSTNCSNN